VGAAFGIPVAMAVLARQDGFGAIAGVNWFEVVSAAVPLLLRGLAGTLPMVLWLTPLIFVLMAASAWLKRLGVPLVMVGSALGVLVLDKVYGVDWPLQSLLSWNEQINSALINDAESFKHALMSGVDLWAWALQDFGRALASLASLQFIICMAIAAAGFALVVLKRARGG